MHIEARGISAGYGRTDVIRNIDLCLNSAEFVGLIGPNGSGKSTLLRTLSRTLPIRSGSLSIGGRRAETMTAREIARQIGFVPQAEPALFEFTARDVVLMGRNPHVPRFASESEADFAAVARAMAATDTLQLADRPVTELSGGEHRRVLIARALAQKAPTLLLDEPTAHLDLPHQRDILSLVREQVRGEGVSGLAALHDLNLAAAFCDRLILLADGGIVAEGPVDEILKEEALARAFGTGIRVERSAFSGGPVVLPAPPMEQGGSAGGHRIHVVCGGGSGVEILSALHRHGHSVTAGVLNRTDTDQAACAALGIPHVCEAPFSPIGEDARHRCAEMMRDAEIVVLTDAPFGMGNLANLELAAAAQQRGKLVYLVGMTPIESRDFTGGEASLIWNRLIEGGARPAADAHALDTAVGAAGSER